MRKTLRSAHPLQKARDSNVAETLAAPTPCKRSLRGLDWLNFLVAAMQMGFGPFLSVYLTAHLWDPQQIGLAFSLGAAFVLVGVAAKKCADCTLTGNGTGTWVRRPGSRAWL
jgi:hypothetical protein